MIKIPELPDVEVFRQKIDETALNKTIKQVIIKDATILDTSEQKIQNLKGEKFKKTKRQGKYCFIELNKNKTIALHFGMTGNIAYYKDAEPDYAKIIFQFSDNHNLAFVNKRKLGHVYLTKNDEEFIKEHDIGIDALTITKHQFNRLMNKKKGQIKTALMDQKTMSGIGNIYSDEILYHAYIKPQRKINELDERELDAIYFEMKQILQHAINADALPEKMPSDYLIHIRHEGEKCRKCHGEITKTKINGRGSYYCSKHQK